MVTHRGTAQNDATVQVAAEPADGPGSETTLALLRNGPRPNGILARLFEQFHITDRAKWPAA